MLFQKIVRLGTSLDGQGHFTDFQTQCHIYCLSMQSVADPGGSGPWGTQFCGTLCTGVTQCFPAGVAL